MTACKCQNRDHHCECVHVVINDNEESAHLLLRMIRAEIRKQGGNVQTVLGG